MDKDAYIKQLEEENARLKKRIEELEQLLGMNSKNSSLPPRLPTRVGVAGKPPSSDPPGISAVLPKRRRKKRGAKKGHRPHLRQLFPQDVTHADETGWRRGNRQRAWLWTFCCATATVFMVPAKRGQQAASPARQSMGGASKRSFWQVQAISS